jgi:hypothetical protein
MLFILVLSCSKEHSETGPSQPSDAQNPYAWFAAVLHANMDYQSIEDTDMQAKDINSGMDI